MQGEFAARTRTLHQTDYNKAGLRYTVSDSYKLLQGHDEEPSSLDSLTAILRLARADNHLARLAYVHAMSAAAVALGYAGCAQVLLPLARELATAEDEAVRQAVAQQLAPLGAVAFPPPYTLFAAPLFTLSVFSARASSGFLGCVSHGMHAVGLPGLAAARILVVKSVPARRRALALKVFEAVRTAPF